LPSSERRFVVGADNATRLRVAADWLRSYPADAELLLVGPSWHACDELVRTVAAEGGARFGVVRLTFERLAVELARPWLLAEGRAPATRLAVTAIVARAVHALVADERLRYFAPVANRPGFPPAVASTLEELRMGAIAPAALEPLEAIGDDLAAIARRVDEELRAFALADRATIFAAAIDALAGPVGTRRRSPAGRTAAAATPRLAGLPLLLLDLEVESERAQALLAALVASSPDVLATAPAGDERTIARLARALGRKPEETRQDGAGSSLVRLKQHLFAASAPEPCELDASVTVASWPGEARECLEIARSIQREAARGVPFDRMAVFLHAPREYTAHLEEALTRADIPAFYARGTARPHPAGRALLALLACAAEGLSARRFAEYLSLAEVPEPDAAASGGAPSWVDAWVTSGDDLLPSIDPANSTTLATSESDDALLLRDPDSHPVIAGTLRAPWRWEQILVDAAVIGGKARWARRLEGLEAELRKKLADLGEQEDEARAAHCRRMLGDLGELRQFALPILERLERLPARAPWSEWLSHLRELAGAALRHPEPVLATLGELDPIGPVGPIELDEVRIVLTPRLRDAVLAPPRRRYGSVFIAPAESARGLAFDVVLIPGLAERLFPRKIVEDPILPDHARAGLVAERPARDGRRSSEQPPASEARRLATQEERGAAERLALRIAVGAARERALLSYPRVDVEQARPRVPSFYALEALRAAEGALPGFDELGSRAQLEPGVRLGWPAPSRAEDAIDASEYDLALLAPLMHGDDRASAGAAHYLLNANPHLERALRARARRWLRRWTTADGLVDPDELGSAALTRHGLGARSFSPTALQNFAACPYRFFLQAILRLEPRQDPVAIETIDPLTRGALFHDIQFKLLSRLRDRGLLPLRPGASLEEALACADVAVDEEAARAEQDLAPAIPRVWEDGITAIRADIREWLRRAAEAGDGWVPHRFELSFGIDRDRTYADPASLPGPVALAGGLDLRGSIDLVECREDGTLRVTDHKTGKPRAREATVVGGGEILQPVLYALACERIFSAPVSAGRLYYCTADGGYTERVVPLDARSRTAALEVVGIVGHALRDGFLPQAPRKDACRYCDYRPVCGPHEELRVERKPRDRLAELQRLREMP